MPLDQARAPEHSDSTSRTEQARSQSARVTPDLKSNLAVRAGEILLAAGEQLRVSPGAIAKAPHADVEAATAWRQRRLVFRATPLTEVADEINRYNTRQLIVGSAGLDHFKVSAVFSATDLPSLLRFLRAQPNIIVEEDDAEIRILEK
jgi:transmembrane sensor